MRWLIYSFGCWFGISTFLAAQEIASPEMPAKDELLIAAHAHVDTIEVTIERDGAKVNVERLKEPLLSSSDAVRGELGWTWAFGTEGRPVVLMELWRDRNYENRWAHALILSSDSLAEGRLPGGGTWQPQRTQLQLQDIPDMGPPSNRKNLWQHQAKEAARRFTAHEFWGDDNQRAELRLLERPLLTYRDEAAGILEGKLFVFTHGTNPEAFLLTEVHVGADDMRTWKYGLLPSSSAELHVEIDGKEVWKLDRAPRIVGYPTDPYWIVLTFDTVNP